MTVSYSSTVATVSYNSFALLLLRWRGSVYKAVWPILLFFCGAYVTVALTFYLLPNQTEADRAARRKFVQLCAFAGRISSAIPISFFLGFFVNIVVSRWWQQFLNLPTPDSVCTLLSAYVVHDPQKSHKSTVPEEKAERPLMLRRAIARYLNLSTALCFHSISLSVKRKLPKLEDFVATGLITDQEVHIYRKISMDKPFFFAPLVWCISLLTRAHRDGIIRHDRQLSALVDAVVRYWHQLHTLFLYDYVNVPLVYNQVVTLVVYIYLAILVLSQQFADPAKILKEYDKEVLNLRDIHNGSTIPALNMVTSYNNNMSSIDAVPYTPLIDNQTSRPDLVDPNQSFLASALTVSPNIPVFAILSLICYTGWLRVAESHVFPFGDDDDHFETLPLMDRNFKTSLWFVDYMMQYDQLAPLVRAEAEPLRTEPEATEPSEPYPCLVSNIFNRGAMGLKRSIERPTQLMNRGSLHVPTISITAPPPDKDSAIPELPCPAELRRRASRHFFVGSMTRVYGEDSAPLGHQSSVASVSPYFAHPSMPSMQLDDSTPESNRPVNVSLSSSTTPPQPHVVRRPFSSTQETVGSDTLAERETTRVVRL